MEGGGVLHPPCATLAGRALRRMPTPPHQDQSPRPRRCPRRALMASESVTKTAIKSNHYTVTHSFGHR
eukprot:3313993-Prymnesium_polylepis.1